MRLKLVKTLWGYTEGATGAAELRRIKQAGFDGVEWAVPQAEPAAWRDWCRELGLDYVAMIFAYDAQTFAEELRKAAKYGPVLIVAHDGRDKMTFAEGCAYFREVLRAEADTGIPVAHETHRHRLFYAPWATAPYLQEFSALKVCADFSHWCCVCESLLKDMEEWVELACRRTIHIHGRVGWEEGPQLSDPRAPEYQHYVARHEEWWDAIRAARAAAGAEVLTFDPEYGPPGYMPALPYTRQPIVDLWDIHQWAAQRIRARWEHQPGR